VAQFRPVTGSGDSSQDASDLELGQAAFSTQQHSSLPLHADAAASAAAAASGLQHELAPGEQLAEVVSAEVNRQRFEALYENSDRLVHNANGSSRDLSSPADDEQLPLLAEFAAHPIPAHHATSAADAAAADSAAQPSSTQQVASASVAPAAAAAAAGAAAAAAEAGPAMIGGGIPRSIFVLSMVSMALTSASCVFNTLLPIYMVTELKMTMRTMGMFEGGC
jgi:hypothetical protein